MASTIPKHLRQNLLRLYLIISVIWVGCFGYAIYDSYRQYRSTYDRVDALDKSLLDRWRTYERFPAGSLAKRNELKAALAEQAGRVDSAVTLLPLVPVGAPLLYFITGLIIAGFRKSTRKVEDAAPQPDPTLRQSIDAYQGILARAVAELADDTFEARQAIYAHTRTVLVAQLHKQGTPTDWLIAREQAALEAAIRDVEAGASGSHPAVSADVLEASAAQNAYYEFTRKNPSTLFLIVCILFFRSAWALDFTSASLYWVARLPKGGPAQRTGP